MLRKTESNMHRAWTGHVIIEHPYYPAQKEMLKHQVSSLERKT